MKRLAFILILILLSCKKQEKLDMHYEYYPVQKGSFVVYKAVDIFIDTLQLIRDTNSYFLKCKIGDTLIDNSGRIVNRYERYTSASQNGPWLLKDIWTTVVNGNKAELVEENERVIKFIFAPTKNKSWDANAYNTLTPLNCYFDRIHKSFSVLGTSFDKTTTVEQEDELNFFQFKRKYEVYAKDIGLVKKMYKDLQIYNQDTTKIKFGNVRIYEYLSHGVE